MISQADRAALQSGVMRDMVPALRRIGRGDLAKRLTSAWRDYVIACADRIDNPAHPWPASAMRSIEAVEAEIARILEPEGTSAS